MTHQDLPLSPETSYAEGVGMLIDAARYSGQPYYSVDEQGLRVTNRDEIIERNKARSAAFSQIDAAIEVMRVGFVAESLGGVEITEL